MARMRKMPVKQKLKKYDKNQQRDAELAAVYKIHHAMGHAPDLEHLLPLILQLMAREVKGTSGSIMLMDDCSDALVIYASRGIPDTKRPVFKKGEGIAGWVFEHRQPVIVDDMTSDPRFKNSASGSKEKRHLISVPIFSGDVPIGVINVERKLSAPTFGTGELQMLAALARTSGVAIQYARFYHSMQTLYFNTIRALAVAIDAKDHYTRSHSENVRRYSLAITDRIGLKGHDREVIDQAAQLHDLGKIGIHDFVLSKPGPLTIKEWEEVKLHSLVGAEILEPFKYFDGVIGIVRLHHERYDGNGYPYGYKGEQIPVGARILAVADAFDAMISERPYRGAMSITQAIAELKKGSGSQFDPEIVNTLLQELEENPSLAVIQESENRHLAGKPSDKKK